MKWLAIIPFLLLTVISFSQVLTDPIRKGNQLYQEKKYDEAEVQYRRADAEKNMALRQFNLGDALYKQERYEEASKEFNALVKSEADNNLRAKAYHNLGNSLIKENKLKQGVEAYKNSLRLNPDDSETRSNLVRALQQMQQQQQQQQGEGEDQENKNQDQQPNPQQDQNNQNQPPKNNQNQNPDQQNQQNQKPREGEISREDAERLLEALSKAEEKVQQKVNKEKMKGKKTNSEKDW